VVARPTLHSTSSSDETDPMPTMTEAASDLALAYARRTLAGVTAKAASNKRLTTFLFLTILIPTTVSPILILAANDPLAAKVLPSILSACAAVASAWIQLRKPQERWAIYRTAQREVEFEIDQYQFGNGRYAEPAGRGSLLADAVSKRALQLHFEWLPIAPRAEDARKVLASSTDTNSHALPSSINPT
jgi:Protein of unknown function (DUF4231)